MTESTVFKVKSRFRNLGIFLLVESGIHVAFHADVLRGCHAFLPKNVYVGG